jgi:hypothetical protein
VQSFGSPTHWPTTHTPLTSHSSVGVHAVPSLTGATLHVWVPSEQMAASHGDSGSPQSLVGPPKQVPPSQKSSIVQNTPSSHGVPVCDATTMHTLMGPQLLPGVAHGPGAGRRLDQRTIHPAGAEIFAARPTLAAASAAPFGLGELALDTRASGAARHDEHEQTDKEVSKATQHESPKINTARAGAACPQAASINPP